jgi:hypothetical protein
MASRTSVVTSVVFSQAWDFKLHQKNRTSLSLGEQGQDHQAKCKVVCEVVCCPEMFGGLGMLHLA